MVRHCAAAADAPRRPAARRLAAMGPTALSFVLATMLAGCTPGAGPTPSPTMTPVPSVVPLPTTARISATYQHAQWTLVFRTSDALRAYVREMEALRAAGFAWSSDLRGQDGGYGQACTDKLCVSVTAVSAASDGPNIELEIFRSGMPEIRL